MPLIECKLGHTDQMVMGQNYSFTRDRYGRFVAVVHNDDHAAVFLAVEHYCVAPELPEAPAPTQPSPSTTPTPLVPAFEDDIGRIKGIGPKLKVKLEGVGVISIVQIADLSPEQEAQLDTELKLSGAIRRDDWIGQAKALIAEAPAPTQE